MKKLISEERIKEKACVSALERIDPLFDKNKINASFFKGGFREGAVFAETELQNLAIEFAEWLLTNKCVPFDSLYWQHQQYFTSKELFSFFIEQRNKHPEIVDPLAILREDCYSNASN
jgi:hypothetical protein